MKTENTLWYTPCGFVSTSNNCIHTIYSNIYWHPPKYSLFRLLLCWYSAWNSFTHTHTRTHHFCPMSRRALSGSCSCRFCCFSIIIYLQILCVCSRNLLLSRINDEHCLFIVGCLCRARLFSKCFDLRTFREANICSANDMSTMVFVFRTNWMQKKASTQNSYKISSRLRFNFFLSVYNFFSAPFCDIISF